MTAYHLRGRDMQPKTVLFPQTILTSAHYLARLVALLLVLLSWAPGEASADWINLLELRSEYLRPTELEGERPAGNAPWSDANDVQVSTYAARANLPIPLGNSTLLVPGLGYRLDSLSFNHQEPDERNLRLHALEVPITVLHLLSSEWTLLANLSPSLASDEVGFESKALRASGLAVASYSFRDEFVLGGGVAASLDFGSLLPIPVVFVDWKPHPAVTVDALLPLQLDAKVALGGRFEVGVHADIDGNSYYIGDSDVRDRWPCSPETDDPGTDDDESLADESRCVQQLAYSTATGGVVVSARLVGSVWLSLYTGYTFARRFEETNSDGDQVDGGDQTLPNDFFARAGLTWRLPDQD